MNIDNINTSNNQYKQDGRRSRRSPSTLPVDYSSDTADPSPQRRSGSSGGDVVVVVDVVVGGNGGGSDDDGDGVRVAGVAGVKQESQQAVLKRDERGDEGCGMRVPATIKAGIKA